VFRKVLTLSLVVLLIGGLCVTCVVAASKREEEARSAAKVKSEVAKLGTGQQARVELKLRDGSEFKGYVREWDETEFVVVDAKSGVATTVTYPQVQTIKRSHGLSTAEKIGIGVAGGMGAVLLIGTYCNHHGCKGW
jgi:NMD protein affecting ribosome stability and mRNA decay